ncbi:protein phosphatase 1, regulatory (inhibitor) subunit 14Ab [Heterodontus francisci]|uniref:protein phosphatase 1, regulatory (inhibitor) subunit 14Ab n=1 Tax=Heterodontus francisci TaxID=7792 RepID=UPI00355B00E1
MAAQRVGRKGHSRLPASPREPGAALQRRQARVTVRYDRRELQNRLDVEKWIEENLLELYQDQVDQMPEEVNIDDLLELQTDDERGSKLQIMFTTCSKNTDEFISELLTKLHGLHKVQVQNVGLTYPQQH